MMFLGILRKRFRGRRNLSLQTMEEIWELVDARKKRGKEAILAATAFGGIGTGIYTYFKPILNIALAGAIAGAIPSGIAQYVKESKKVKMATKIVQKILVDEAEENVDLVHFLSKYKYIIIDRKGNIAGTNMPRLFGIGRIRLSTKKILEGKY